MGDAAEPIALKWTKQLKVVPLTQTPKLVGDKIVLPQAALEELLAAATVTVVSTGEPSSSFDPFNPFSVAAERGARAQVLERHQDLPQPLTFRLVNPENGNFVYAGIREFSAPDDGVGLSPFLRTALGLQDDEVGAPSNLTVHAQQLPKGKHVRFRPLEAGYDPDDWKALLERQLRNSFTTLTKGEILQIQSGKEEYRFLVDKIEPDGQGICIVDTDLEVDIEALNEEQARETLKKRLEKNQKQQTNGGSTIGGVIAVGASSSGQVLPGDYVDYELVTWDRAKDLEIELELSQPGTADLFISPFKATQRKRPREDEHVFSELSEQATKRLRVQHSNHELDGAEAVYISVFGNSAQDPPARYNLAVQYLEPGATEEQETDSNIEHDPNEVQCKNCLQWVPQRTMMLHENFCYRNNTVCPDCKEVFKKSSDEWQQHWHCPYDAAHGNSANGRQRHFAFFHTSATCKACGYSARSVSDLAHHRTSTCPEKLILCQFCHLLVPQRGPDDLDPQDPEVILSGLTPHELSDGSTTTDCHMCGKIVRLRDMPTHLRHHDLDRLSRPTPRLCRNNNCGRTMDGVGPNGTIRQPQDTGNVLGLCSTCFGPLYNSSYDPDLKGLRRRVERRYLTQLITGCGKSWCRNEWCKTGSRNLMGLSEEAAKATPAISSKEATAKIKPVLDSMLVYSISLNFCTDEQSQLRRTLAQMLSERDKGQSGYDLPWCVAAMEAAGGDMEKATVWLESWAPRRGEV